MIRNELVRRVDQDLVHSPVRLQPPEDESLGRGVEVVADDKMGRLDPKDPHRHRQGDPDVLTVGEHHLGLTHTGQGPCDVGDGSKH